MNNIPLWTTLANGVVDGDSANKEKTNNAQCITKYVNMNLILNIHTLSYVIPPYFSGTLFL